MSFEKNIMYSSLFDSFIADSLFTPMRTVYVVSDSQLDHIKRKQHQNEIENIETSRKHLEEKHQSRLKILDERQNKLQEELKLLSESNKEKVIA